MALTKVSRGLLSTSIEDNGNATAITIDSSENVGIGTSSPTRPLSITDTTSDGSGGVIISSYLPVLEMDDISGGGTSFKLEHNQADTIFKHDSTERMRIDSSGNLLVGTTDTDLGYTDGDSGVVFNPDGYIQAARDSAFSVLYLNKLNNDGTIIQMHKDGSTVGTIGCTNSGDTFRLIASNNYVAVGAGSTGLLMQDSNNIRPYNPSNDSSKDNAIGLGKSWARFTDLWAVDNSINTSDFNEKQDIAELSEAEQRVAVACKGLLRKFRWKDAVSKKGDDARIHFGIIAQNLQAAFEAEGLDASRYAMWCSDTWWEQDVEVPAVEAVDAVYETQTDEEGNETQVLVQEAVEAVDAYTRTDTFETAEEAPEGATEKTRLGVRYSELLAFIISAI